MALYLDGIPDRMALAGGRELDEIPWHFERIRMDGKIDANAARAWIWKNLTGRFCVIFLYESRDSAWYAGFEDPSEASAFVLNQPLISQSGIFDPF